MFGTSTGTQTIPQPQDFPQAIPAPAVEFELPLDEPASEPERAAPTRRAVRQDTVRLAVLRYLLSSSQDFRDLSRGRQVMRIREHYGWCESSIPTVLRALSYWQSAVRVAAASPDVERRRLRKSARKRDKKFNKLCRRRGESLHNFQKRVLEELPSSLKELALIQLGTELPPSCEWDGTRP